MYYNKKEEQEKRRETINLTLYPSPWQGEGN